MKKQLSFFKGKGFYVSLCIGAFALIAMGIVTYSMYGINPKEGTPNQEQVQNNETNKNDVAKLPVEQKQIVQSTPTSNAVVGDVKENKENKENVKAATEDKKSTEAVAKEKTDDAVAVINTNSKSENLHFNEEKGLLWPITGNVVMNYSMDTTIYFKTLGIWKCNPAIIIEGKVGSDVFCAADGIVTDIVDSEETGLTVTTSVGDGYNIVYGQLKDLTVKVGDNIAAGNIVGKIAKPSNYYIMENSNLYFEVLQDDKPVNPLLLLR